MLQRITLVVGIGLLLASCQKSIEISTDLPSKLHQVKKILSDSLPADLYPSLDWTAAVRTKYPTDSFRIYRIPFRRKPGATDFVLLKITHSNRNIEGRIIQLEETDHPTSSTHRPSFEGRVFVRWLNGQQQLASEIVKGHVTAFHNSQSKQGKKAEEPITPAPEYVEMPEVIIVCTPSQDYDYNFNVWVSALSFLGGSSGGGSGDWPVLDRKSVV